MKDRAVGVLLTKREGYRGSVDERRVAKLFMMKEKAVDFFAMKEEGGR